MGPDHASDCAVNNGPALPAGECDCGGVLPPPVTPLPSPAEKLKGNEFLSLKWGTVKAWQGLSDTSVAIMQRYFADGMVMSAAMDRPTPERTEILCELIDQIDGDIWNDWDDREMSKDEAKEYVRNYNKKT